MILNRRALGKQVMSKYSLPYNALSVNNSLTLKVLVATIDALEHFETR